MVWDTNTIVQFRVYQDLWTKIQKLVSIWSKICTKTSGKVLNPKIKRYIKLWQFIFSLYWFSWIFYFRLRLSLYKCIFCIFIQRFWWPPKWTIGELLFFFFFKFWYNCIFRPMALPSSRPATAKRSSINKRFGYQNNSSARALYNTVCRAPRSSNLKWPFPGVHEEGERKTAWWSFLAIFLKMNTLLRIQLLGKNSKYVKITPMDSFKGRFLTTFFLNVFLAFFSTFFFLDFFLTFFRDCAWKLSHNILCNDHNWLEAETDQPFLTC